MDLEELSQFYDSDMSFDEFVQLQNISLKHEQDLAYFQSEQKDLEKKLNKDKKVHFDAEKTKEPEKVEPEEPNPSLDELRKLRLKYFKNT